MSENKRAPYYVDDDPKKILPKEAGGKVDRGDVTERALPLSHLSKFIAEVEIFANFELRAKQVLQKILVEMLFDIFRNGCKLAKHRKSKSLDIEDIELYISMKYGRQLTLHDAAV